MVQISSSLPLQAWPLRRFPWFRGRGVTTIWLIFFLGRVLNPDLAFDEEVSNGSDNVDRSGSNIPEYPRD